MTLTNLIFSPTSCMLMISRVSHLSPPRQSRALVTPCGEARDVTMKPWFRLLSLYMHMTFYAGSSSGVDGGNCSPCSKKYVLLCAACGGLAVVLGSLFAVLYVVLRSYTSSLHYFETVPSYVASVSVCFPPPCWFCLKKKKIV